jgi:hypothetical protein
MGDTINLEEYRRGVPLFVEAYENSITRALRPHRSNLGSFWQIV